MTQIGFAIAGTGNIAEKHAAAIRDADGAVLVAVHSRGRQRRDEFAQRWSVDGEADLSRLLARPDVQAITIATPSGAHLDVALAAAKAGKHLLCEKPLEVTVERVDKIIDACRRHKVILAGVFQSRLDEHVRQIKRAIEAGRFGKLLLAGAQVKWFRDQAYYDSGQWRGTWELDGGGALMNQSIHAVDLLCHLAGPAESVCAAGGTRTHQRIEVEDTVAAMVKFRNGAVGTIEASTSCAPGFARRIEISGENGSIVLEGDRLARWSFAEETDEDRRLAEQARAGDHPTGGASDPNAISHEGHRRLVEDLVRAIRTGGQPVIPGAEARVAVELICGIYDSMRTGKPHHFPA